MQRYCQRGRLQVALELDQFITGEALPESQISLNDFWSRFENILNELVPQNQALLSIRDKLQSQIDEYCRANKNTDINDYKAFLREIGYLQSEPEDFTISTENVDAEIASMAGPQLVVPINNARFALNAANARWGSLYDAAYGTDVIDETDGATKGKTYNPVRGQKVIKFARHWLNTICPLLAGKHEDAIAYDITTGSLIIYLSNQQQTTLQDPAQLIGYQGELSKPSTILLKHHGLHIEIQLDREHLIGKTDPAGIKDIFVESALTTIMDCEDSVAAVDAEDKTLVYRNWLGLMNGTLSATVKKPDKKITRKMNIDRRYHSMPKNIQNQNTSEQIILPGRSLMFVRNVGHLMTNEAILFDGIAIPEGIMDAMITSLIGKHDLLKNSHFTNSQAGSIYIVKPKMHGPDEVAFADKLFARVEDALELSRNTIKMGIMDEERRTSINLKACIYAARERTVFINTGFLDRTGDEIHTSMLLGPFATKAEIKNQSWLSAYEKSNVIVGLNTGMSGKAQIGKGMWPTPDQMANMMQAKIGHPLSGANTAWVPSPTAATLHALHYHQTDVFAIRVGLSTVNFDGLNDILTVPLMDDGSHLSEEQVQHELDNNVQGILGYVVRWVHQGVGCSKVPDLDNVGLMEDRATLRISSQHIANWLEHGVITEHQVNQALQRLAILVDEQNSNDNEYIMMTPDTERSIAFQAAHELIFKGKLQPNGYTEPVLHLKRQQMKACLRSNER
ncbi:MAG: malate synthase [Paraglaciecola sp.]|jgi:malate synthase